MIKKSVSNNICKQSYNVKNRQDEYLLANMEYGARLDCKKNPKALNNSAGKFLFPGQAHTKPEEGVKIVRIVVPIHLSKEVTALSSWNWVSPPSVRAEAEIIRCR